MGVVKVNAIEVWTWYWSWYFCHDCMKRAVILNVPRNGVFEGLSSLLITQIAPGFQISLDPIV